VDEVLPEFTKRVLGMNVRDLTRADALALMRAREFDAYFPASRMEAAITGQVREMGVDPLAAGRITLDTGDREGKRSRAFCSPVRVPSEVYLVLRPHGGQTDWNTFLHELGHALHFAYMRPDLAFEYRWLGDNSITEGYAMFFDHSMKDRGWLKRYTELGESKVDNFLRTAGFEELQFLRRYCAKLIYEVELYGGKRSWDSLPICTSRPHPRHDVPLRSRGRVRRRRPAILCGAVSARVAATGADPRNAWSNGTTTIGGGIRAPDRGSVRPCSVKDSESSPTSRRSVSRERCYRSHL
jgi:hypothetical protein